MLGRHDRYVADDATGPPRVAFLDAQCAPRRDCAADAYARSLCARSFKDDVLAAPIHGRFPYVGTFCAG